MATTPAAPDLPAYGPLLLELFETTPIGVAFVDSGLRYLAVNAAYARMTGSYPGACVGRRVDEIQPALAGEIIPLMTRVFETGEPVPVELTGTRSPYDVESRSWAGIYHPLVREDRVTAVGVMIRDVTDRRRSERTQGEALHREQLSRQLAEQQRDFFRLVLENAPMGVSICEGPDHRLLLINDFSLQIVKLPREALIGRPIRETFPEAFELVRDTYDRVYRTGEVQTVPELLVPLPDGRSVWIYACYAPIRDDFGTPLGVMSLALDISALKRLQAFVESQKQVLEAIAEGQPLPQVLQAIVEVVERHAAGGIPSVLLVHADHLRHGASSRLLSPAYIAAVDGLRVGGEGGASGIVPLDRRRVIIEDVTTDRRCTALHDVARAAGIQACWSTPVVGATGRLLGALAVYYREPRSPSGEELDLVDLMVRTSAFAIEWCLADEERRALLEAERAARADAEAANRSKDEFVAALSHELRTPLNAILGWARMLRAGQLQPDEQARALEAIERNTRAQSQLVEDLLDISRIVTGKIRLDVRSVELTTVIEAAVDAVRPAADAKGIRVQKVIDPRAAPIAGDPDRLQQVVWNLLSNAIKFTPRGGRVQVRLERINSHIEIVVADSGIGIAPDLLPHVFDRFRQGDRSGSKTTGLGLGLAIARHLIELHGGAIDAASDGADTGATFRVKLPLVLAQPPRSPRDMHPTASEGVLLASLPRLHPIRVLVVEDDEDGREVVATILSSAGADVRAAASAAEGSAILAGWRPDVLISDIDMPEEDGYAFVSRVRQEPGLSARDMPAIALTAYARVEDRIKALAAGFQMHVPKPVEPAELIAVVAAVVPRPASL